MVEGSATDAAFAVVLLVLGGLIVVGLAVMVRGFLTMYGIWGFVAECTASRDVNITSSVFQPRRRTIVMPIPAESIISVSPARPLSPGIDYAVPRPCDVDAIKAGSVTYDLASLTAPAVPELPPVVPVVEEEESIPWTWPVPESVPATNRQSER